MLDEVVQTPAGKWIAAVVVAWFWAMWVCQAHATFLAAQAAAAAERAAIIARADEQHRQVLRGDNGASSGSTSSCLTVRLLFNAVEVAETGAIRVDNRLRVCGC